MPGNRMSVLPQAQRCGHAARLSGISTRVNALLGTAWHANNLQTGSDAARAALAKLTPDEIAEISSWKRPTDIETPHGTLKYDHAWTEVECALNLDGDYCDPSESTCITIGHVDMHWILGPEDARVLYVVDAKRSEWTTADGPDTLQLHSYGMALASKYGCSSYVTGIWACIEGRWWWNDHAVDMWSDEAFMLRQRIVAAATNIGGQYTVGSHCRSCYGREHCPAWLFPEGTTFPALEDVTKLDNDAALAALVTVQRMEDTATKAKAILKEWALKNGGIRDASTGKKWVGTKMPGRESLNQAALAAAGIDLKPYMRTGKDYEQMRWVNDK